MTLDWLKHVVTDGESIMQVTHGNGRYYRQNDQYVCPVCGKSWDINDDAPPCKTGDEWISEIRRKIALHQKTEGL